MTYKDLAQLPADKVFNELGTSPQGLAPAVAAQRLNSDGPNRLAPPPARGRALFFRQLRSPLMLILGVAIVVAAVVGDIGSAITIFAFLCINAALGFFQEYRSERVLTKLNIYITGTVRILRGGEWQKISKDNVVVGDVVALEAGNMFPADMRILRADNLLVQESALTGESAPVSKTSTPLTRAPGSALEATNIGFAGTLVAAGSAEGVVFATGAHTVFGVIAGEASAVKRPSLFEQNIAGFSRFLMRVVIITLAVVYAANLIIKRGAADPAELLLFSLALAVSVIPEALPAVMTITFSKGALTLAKKKVIIKRLSAIEDLGHIEILCTDKTGTITENKLTVGRVSCADANVCVRAGLFASEPPEEGEFVASSFDSALWQFASDEQRTLSRDLVRCEVFPFDPARRRNTVVAEYGGKRYLAVKGAPEDILDLAGMTGESRASILNEFKKMGAEGMRVLAIGQREVSVKDEYSSADEAGITFLGLVGFLDPLKPTARAAIQLAEQLHVRVKMVTGDSLEVATAVGIEAGIISTPKDAIAGPTLEALDEEAFSTAVERFDVLARITPELKYRIVNTLERTHATGFLGEGVNDAPALKSANVGLVVAEAADVAREAADVVLLDRSLAVVIDGIREGRTIFANVLKYIKYTLVGNFGNFYSIAIISLFIDFLPMTPQQLLLINVLTDFPLIAVATDLVDSEEVGSPRRFSVRDIALFTIVLGLVSSVFDFIFFGLFRHAPEAVLQTNWFILSVLSEIVLIFALRTNRFFLRARRPGSILLFLAVVAVATALILPYTAVGHRVFGLVPPGPMALTTLIIIVVGYLITTEAAKHAYRRFIHTFAPRRT